MSKLTDETTQWRENVWWIEYPLPLRKAGHDGVSHPARLRSLVLFCLIIDI